MRLGCGFVTSKKNWVFLVNFTMMFSALRQTPKTLWKKNIMSIEDKLV